MADDNEKDALFIIKSIEEINSKIQLLNEFIHSRKDRLSVNIKQSFSESAKYNRSFDVINKIGFRIFAEIGNSEE